MPAFHHIGAYYDVLAQRAGRLDREGPLLDGLLRQSPGCAVIDLACGTGLHAVYFAELGANVTAQDLSPGMITYASAHHPHPNIHYATGDMRWISGGPWDLAVCLGNSLCLLEGKDSVDQMFASIGQSLTPGGLLLTQTINYDHPAAQAPRHRVETTNSGNTAITAVKSLVPSDGKTYLSLAFFADEQAMIQSVSETAILQHLNRAQLEESAASAGLTTISVWGGYDRSPFDPAASADLLMLFRRPA